MLKYVDTKIVFQEVPDEVTLAINISNCPCHCKGCHSPYLAEDIGTPLNWNALLYDLIPNNKGITCICFLGGDAEPIRINILGKYIKENFPHLKVAWYSGRQYIPDEILVSYFDYIKIGPYIPELGGLDSENTNQIMYKIEDDKLIDITYRFRHDFKSSI